MEEVNLNTPSTVQETMVRQFVHSQKLKAAGIEANSSQKWLLSEAEVNEIASRERWRWALTCIVTLPRRMVHTESERGENGSRDQIALRKGWTLYSLLINFQHELKEKSFTLHALTSPLRSRYWRYLRSMNWVWIVLTNLVCQRFLLFILNTILFHFSNDLLTPIVLKLMMLS